MFSLDKKTGYCCTFICLTLLFLPKVNIITFAGRETAGIRIDDLVLFLFSLLIFWGHISTRKKLLNIEKLVYVIVGFSLFSYFCNRFFVLNSMLHVDASILYALRIFEYFIFFYIGFYASRIFSINKVIIFCFLLNFAFMLLQKVGLVGFWGMYGYESSCVWRCSGLSSFPSEMGMMLNLFFCYLLFNKDEVLNPIRSFFRKDPALFLVISKIYPFILFSVIGALLMINASRIALLAHLVVFIMYLCRGSLKTVAPITAFLVFIAYFSWVSFDPTALEESILYSRSEKLISYDNLTLIEDVWDMVDIEDVPIGNEAVTHDAKSQDESWWIRIHKWLYALKIYSQHPESYLQGIGPGFAMAGMDGGILRIFVEYGIVGFCLFFYLFYKIAKTSLVLKYCIIAFLINMCFFDVYLAYKPMALIFLITGNCYAKYSLKTIKI
ncbi:MAG: hypothetical protein VX777_02825 [Chlamydiota bacterium]|nr:hypothetical protein [Chlamydiota bacterium]